MKSRPILSLFGLYLSVVCAWGDSYNVNVAPGYNLFANQLTLSSGDLNSVLGGGVVPGGTIL
jgi:hypothetical protein